MKADRMNVAPPLYAAVENRQWRHIGGGGYNYFVVLIYAARTGLLYPRGTLWYRKRNYSSTRYSFSRGGTNSDPLALTLTYD